MSQQPASLGTARSFLVRVRGQSAACRSVCRWLSWRAPAGGRSQAGARASAPAPVSAGPLTAALPPRRRCRAQSSSLVDASYRQWVPAASAGQGPRPCVRCGAGPLPLVAPEGISPSRKSGFDGKPPNDPGGDGMSRVTTNSRRATRPWRINSRARPAHRSMPSATPGFPYRHPDLAAPVADFGRRRGCPWRRQPRSRSAGDATGAEPVMSTPARRSSIG